ncbi:dihydrofolate reductase family protein [Oryzibacter oryziterrae]|uniref:dihydrofolate reductase family protein n=1 Tax=Oryzibacter oryziterrae TaxID=2766474 RepID=UPI001F430607|nr:dihydrofolate reductase family protein [Oryzibacter oryziterrae]
MIRGFIASSLDGFIAAADHSLAFLDAYALEDSGYPAFIKDIRTIVMGRHTWDFCRALPDWPYADQDTLLVTSRPVDNPSPRTTIWTGDIDALIAVCRQVPQDVWIVGGGGLQQAFLDAGAIDRLDLFLTPDLLGSGIRLFPGSTHTGKLRLIEVHQRGQLAHLVYGL